MLLHIGILGWMFMILVILYTIRMKYLGYSLCNKAKSKSYPVVRGKITSKKENFRLIFFFPLAFLNIFKLLSSWANKELAVKTGLEMGELVDLILSNSIGTLIEITDDEADIYFEIQ